MGTVSVVGATVGWSEASGAPFFPGRSVPEDHHANDAQARRPAHDKWGHGEGERVAAGGAKQEAERLTGEERGRGGGAEV